MKQVNGIYLPDGDTHFSKHLETGEPYQSKKCKAAIEQVKGRRLAIDIGAHVGLWSLQLADVFADVFAFEPMTDLIECFRLNLQHRDNVYLLPHAVSDKACYINMVGVDENSGNAHVMSDNERLPYNVKIDGSAASAASFVAMSRTSFLPYRRYAAFPLDMYKFAQVDFIKIDVEGWEYNVLFGAMKTITKHKPVVLIEQKPGNAERYGFKRYDALNLLKSWGMIEAWEKAGDHCLKWPS